VITIVSNSQPNNGTVIDNLNGTFTYTPDSGFNGTDVFTYVITDGHNGFSTTTVTINVTPVNDPPIANNDLAITNPNTPVVIAVKTNDSDPDNNLLNNPSVLIVPSNGTVSANSNGTITYAPNNGFIGLDSFKYSLCDITNVNPQPLCDDAWVYVTVNAIGCASVVSATDDSVSTLSSTAITIAVKLNDNPLSASITYAGLPSHGTTVIVGNDIIYTPFTGFSGIDQFAYTICVGGCCAQANVKVLVDGLSPINHPPVAQTDMVNTMMNTSVIIAVQINDSDPDNNALVTSLITSTSNHGGSLLLNGNNIQYTPAIGFIGLDSFFYNICDVTSINPQPLCATGLVIVNVPITSPINHAPIANNNSASTSSTVPVTINVTSNDVDPDTDPFAITGIIGVPTAHNGNVFVNASTGNITYIPNTAFNGIDSFQYIITDSSLYTVNQLSDTAWVFVTVNAISPIFANWDFATTPEDLPVLISVQSNDVLAPGNLGSISISTIASHGAVSVVNGDIQYVPSPNFNGLDTFVYTLCYTNTNVCDTALVIVAVTPTNDKPIAVVDSVTTLITSPIAINPLNNDSDPDSSNVFPQGNVLTVSLANNVLNPTNGSIVLNSTTGVVTYIPNTGFVGTDSFEYIICDNGTPTLCDTAKVYVNIVSVGFTVVANFDSGTTNEDTPITININNNDASPIQPTTNSIVTNPSNGTVLFSGANSISYIPNSNFNGADTLVYSYCILGTNVCDTAIVFITVLPINDPIQANNDFANGNPGSPILTPVVTANDSDPDTAVLPEGNISTSTVIYGPINALHGTVIFNPLTNVFTWTPAAGFTTTGNNIDSFQYTICDNGLPNLCDAAWVYISVSNCTLAADAGLNQNICFGNAANIGGNPSTGISGTGNYTYSWFDGLGNLVSTVANPNVIPLVTTIYTVIVADGSNCVATDTVVIAIVPIPTLSFNLDSVMCSAALPQPLVGNPAGGYFTGFGVQQVGLNYQFNPAIVQLDTPITITYILNSNGCIYSFAQSVVVYGSPVANAGQDTIICPALGIASVQLNATGGTTYSWSPALGLNDSTIANPIATPLVTTIYTVTVTSNGCSSTDAVTVSVCTVTNTPVVIARDDQATSLVNVPVVIGVLLNDSSSINLNDHIHIRISTAANNGSAIVQNNNIVYTPNNGFIGIDTFFYTLCDTLINQPYCDVAMVIVTIKPQATDDVFGSIGSPIPCGDTLLNILSNDLTGSNNVLSVKIITNPEHGQVFIDSNWNVIYTPISNYSGKDQFTYELTVNGLPDLADVSLEVKCVGAPPCEIPTGISPNGDIDNQFFVIACINNYPGNELTIFNRWGNEVFRSKNYQNNWDGLYKGNELPDGTYFYNINFNDGVTPNKTGFVVIHR
jgi:gliding motility-associated-like protein